jgi:hypothetical protein
MLLGKLYIESLNQLGKNMASDREELMQVMAELRQVMAGIEDHLNARWVSVPNAAKECGGQYSRRQIGRIVASAADHGLADGQHYRSIPSRRDGFTYWQVKIPDFFDKLAENKSSN